LAVAVISDSRRNCYGDSFVLFFFIDAHGALQRRRQLAGDVTREPSAVRDQQLLERGPVARRGLGNQLVGGAC
jgi:hypothetical protein